MEYESPSYRPGNMWCGIVSAQALWNRGGPKGRPMPQTALHNTVAAPAEADLRMRLGKRSIVLVGMMGAGKSSVGRRLASRLGLPFTDADSEIEAAAGMSIPDIFVIRGEAEFRSGEARVIARLLDGGPQVLATGGGSARCRTERWSTRSSAPCVKSSRLRDRHPVRPRLWSAAHDGAHPLR